MSRASSLLLAILALAEASCRERPLPEADARTRDLAVILARYDGDKASKAGYDAVLLRNWF